MFSLGPSSVPVYPVRKPDELFHAIIVPIAALRIMAVIAPASEEKDMIVDLLIAVTSGVIVMVILLIYSILKYG
jgi:hypothetical protein